MNRCFLSLPCCLTYPLERAGHACPALRPERVALERVPLGQPPSLHRLRRRFLGLVRRLPRYYGAVRLPVVRPSSACVLGLPDAACPTLAGQADAGSPGSRARCFRTCSGSLTARGPGASRAGDAPDVAFRLSYGVGTPECRLPEAWYFAAQYPACTFPCQRFAAALTDAGA